MGFQPFLYVPLCLCHFVPEQLPDNKESLMKLKKYLFVTACALFLISGPASAQPQPPVLSVTNGSWTCLSWTEVAGATGYLLSYAPMPFTGPASIVSLDMGTRKSVSGELPAGAAFYFAVQSRDNTGVSQYSNIVSINMGSYPIAADVFTTLQKTVIPVALSPYTPQISPADLFLYDIFGFGTWQEGPGLSLAKNTDIMPVGYTGESVTKASHLLNFFTITDVHIADKESPAQGIYYGWTATFGSNGPGGSGEGMNTSSAYSPVICYTTQVLDTAIQTVNALHNQKPFDFGIFLGDAINNTQYNELRWYIDVIDGKQITPSSGDHVGASYIDYQKPYRAAGLNKSIPWYQVVGNHDQFYMGTFLVDDYIRSHYVGDTIQTASSNMNLPPADNQGYYMGVVDGSTPDGIVRGVGPVAYFATPPKVAADPDRRSLSAATISNNPTTGSSTLNWMNEFFNTTSTPVGHGFTQSNIDTDFACYTFEPKTNMPIRVLVLDDTCKANVNAKVPPYYAQGCLDQRRYDWLVGELDRGQADGMLMIIAAHVPVGPQTGLTSPTTQMNIFYDPPSPDPHSIKTDNELLATLHNYPNLLLWIAGHRHMNTITPQPDPSHPETGFWEVETASLRDFPQQFRTFDIVRNSDNTISIIAVDVDPAAQDGSIAAVSRSYAIGTERILGGLSTFATVSSNAVSAELVKQLTPEMQAKIANY
jgi:metallophosphoesterase (TIGR03768 family)